MNQLEVVLTNAEQIIIGFCLSYGTKFGLYLNVFHYISNVHLNLFPNLLVDLIFASHAALYIEKDTRIAAAITYFALARITLHLGETPSRALACLASTAVFKYSLMPEPLQIITVTFLIFMSMFTLPTNLGFKLKYLVLPIVLHNLNSGFQEKAIITLIEDSYLLYNWGLIALFTCLLVIIANYMKIREKTQKKLFHLVLLLVYIPGLSNPIKAVYESALVLLTLIYLEDCRQSDPLFNRIISKFKIIENQQDPIVDHIYLIIGLSFPILFSIILQNNLLAWSGIISLGIGDTFGYFFECCFGKKLLFNRKKTIQGAVGSFISMCLFCSHYNLLDPYLTFYLSLISLYEPFSEISDYLLLPILTFFALSIS